MKDKEAATKCSRCSLPPVPGKSRCAAHLAELAAQTKARRDKRAKRGLCPHCGQAMPGR